MGAITFFRLEDLGVEHAGTITVHSKTMPVGDANYMLLVIEILKFAMSGGAPIFSWGVSTSNDMQNWVEVTAFTNQVAGEGTFQVEGAVRGAYLRVDVTFDLTISNPGDVAFTTFTIVGNLSRSSV